VCVCVCVCTCAMGVHVWVHTPWCTRARARPLTSTSMMASPSRHLSSLVDASNRTSLSCHSSCAAMCAMPMRASRAVFMAGATAARWPGGPQAKRPCALTSYSPRVDWTLSGHPTGWALYSTTNLRRHPLHILCSGTQRCGVPANPIQKARAPESSRPLHLFLLRIGRSEMIPGLQHRTCCCPQLGSSCSSSASTSAPSSTLAHPSATRGQGRRSFRRRGGSLLPNVAQVEAPPQPALPPLPPAAPPQGRVSVQNQHIREGGGEHQLVQKQVGGWRGCSHTAVPARQQVVCEILRSCACMRFSHARTHAPARVHGMEWGMECA